MLAKEKLDKEEVREEYRRKLRGARTRMGEKMMCTMFLKVQ